jgi:hypothetical protein
MENYDCPEFCTLECFTEKTEGTIKDCVLNCGKQYCTLRLEESKSDEESFRICLREACWRVVDRMHLPEVRDQFPSDFPIKFF